MADEESESKEESGEGGEGGEHKKASLDWKKMPKWEKAGVIIAGATLVFLIISWYANRNNSGASSAMPAAGYNGYLPGFAGNTQSADTFPPAPTPTPPPNQPGGPGNTPGSNPLTPLFGGAPPAGFKDVLGNWFTGQNGLVYTIVPGSNGRIWGFNGQLSASTAQKLSQQPNNGMVLLYQQ